MRDYWYSSMSFCRCLPNASYGRAGGPFGFQCSGGVNPPCANSPLRSEFTAHPRRPAFGGVMRDYRYSSMSFCRCSQRAIADSSFFLNSSSARSGKERVREEYRASFIRNS